MTFKARLNRAIHYAARNSNWTHQLDAIRAKAEANNKRDGRAVFELN